MELHVSSHEKEGLFPPEKVAVGRRSGVLFKKCFLSEDMLVFGVCVGNHGKGGNVAEDKATNNVFLPPSDKKSAGCFPCVGYEKYQKTPTGFLQTF